MSLARKLGLKQNVCWVKGRMSGLCGYAVNIHKRRNNTTDAEEKPLLLQKRRLQLLPKRGATIFT